MEVFEEDANTVPAKLLTRVIFKSWRYFFDSDEPDEFQFDLTVSKDYYLIEFFYLLEGPN